MHTRYFYVSPALAYARFLHLLFMSVLLHKITAYGFASDGACTMTSTAAAQAVAATLIGTNFKGT